MADRTMQTVTDEIEKELFNEIIQNLDQTTITVEEAQATAKEFLSLLPLEEKQDLLSKLYKLSIDHSETKSLYLKYAKPIEEEDTKKKLELISQHLKNGQIEHALAVAKGGAPNAE